MRAIDDPRRLPGYYIDEIGRGCRTCGWWIPNDSPAADKQWIEHDHDPLIDIKERLLLGETHFEAADVVFLLALLEPDQWSREAMSS